MASETGSAELPDIGTCSYNGIVFSSLYTSQVSGDAVLDNAKRTVKYLQYTITIDGMVTIDDDIFDATVDRLWMNLRKQLEAQGGRLAYTGKGFGSPFIVNHPGGTLQDVAWGPIPKILEFLPMGASRSAKIKWTVTTCIPEVTAVRAGLPILQFNEETQVVYDEAGYSSIDIKGTLEIAMTRPTQSTLTLTRTVDDFRNSYLRRIAANFDLTRFRVTKRNVGISRDKRTMEWSFGIEELPPTGPPAGILVAHGSFSVAPEKASVAVGSGGGWAGGTVKWICNLRASYTVPKGKPRRAAEVAFAALWHYRMRQSQLAVFAPGVLGGQPVAADQFYTTRYFPLMGLPAGTTLPNPPSNAFVAARQRAFVIRYTVDEGLYLDSKEISFSATWWLACNIDRILQASGVWRYSGIEDSGIWAQSVREISGPNSWLENRLDPAGDVIVDFGAP